MFSYGYLTEGQFANIIRSHGYKFERVEDNYVLFAEASRPQQFHCLR